MKKIIFTAFVLLFAVKTGFAQFDGGDGSESDPYQVATVEQLQEVEGGDYYIQVENIDASGFDFSPIGVFSGDYDGDGHIISNLSIASDAPAQIGLFGELAGGEVRNLGIQGIEIDEPEAENVGAIAGLFAAGLIENVFVTGDISGELLTGGIAGNVIGGTLEDVYTQVTVNGEGPQIGGIAGRMGVDGELHRAYSVSDVSGADLYGIIIGNNEDGTVSDVYWDARESSPESAIGAGDEGSNMMALLTPEMTGDAAEDNMDAFDFESVWATVEDDYPTFQWHDMDADPEPEPEMALATQALDLTTDDTELVVENVVTTEDDYVVITTASENGDFEGAAIAGYTQPGELDGESVVVDVEGADPVDHVAHIVSSVSEETLDDGEVSAETLENVEASTGEAAIYAVAQFEWADETYDEPTGTVYVDEIEILYEGEIGEEMLSIDLHAVDDGDIGAFVGISQEDLAVNETHTDVAIDVLEPREGGDDSPREEAEIEETAEFFAMTHLGEAGTDDDGNRIPAQQPGLLTNLGDGTDLNPMVGDFATVTIEIEGLTVIEAPEDEDAGSLQPFPFTFNMDTEDIDWDDYTFFPFEGASLARLPNPDQSGMNETDFVLEFEKPEGAEAWAGFFYRLDEDIRLTDESVFRLKVWSPRSDIEARMKMENMDGEESAELPVDITEAEEWVQLEWDLSSLEDERWNMVTLFMDLDVDNPPSGGEEDTWYLDDFKLENVDVVTSSEVVETEVPEDVTLEQNYPNPFNPTTNIEFALPEAEHTTLEIYNALGQKVHSLVDVRLSAGSHSVTFDANDLSSGTYIYRLEAGDQVISNTMTLIK